MDRLARLRILRRSSVQNIGFSQPFNEYHLNQPALNNCRIWGGAMPRYFRPDHRDFGFLLKGNRVGIHEIRRQYLMQMVGVQMGFKGADLWSW